MKNIILVFFSLLSINIIAQEINISKSLKGFDKYMSDVLTDWNEPGAGVAIIHNGELVFVKGYGYRDYGNKLPVTKNTLFQIASNTKLFTTIAAGMLVEKGILNWDKPITESVPELQFYNDFLNSNVTLRDMLGHKTGISRHDMIWFQSDFSRKELFERIKYLEPSIPLRQDFIYNNLMYTAVGYSIELRTGKTWEEYVKENIFTPLEMNNTVFSIAEMQKSSDHGIPYNEIRDTTLLYKIPLKEDGAGVGPAGAIITSLDDLSHWVIALMKDGKYKNKEIIPASIINETLKPGIAFRNSELEEKGYKEKLNSTYGMAREIEVYKGNVLTKHGGAMPGFHSQVIILPYDDIGIITFSIGDHGASLGNTIIAYNLVDRLLGLKQTDWNGRLLADHLKRKEMGKKARAQVGFDNVKGTSPTHNINDYLGTYVKEVYGEFIIGKENDSLYFNFRRTILPLQHYHYNRFDTPNDEILGKWSINFSVSPQGEISTAVISIDEGQVTFNKKTDESLSSPEILNLYTGTYEYAGSEFEIKIKDNKLTMLGTTDEVLIPYKKHIFKVEKFDDMQIEFTEKNNKISGMKYKAPSGIFECKKIK
ncbi:serine hydrolase [Algibacter wandonensis]|uniref:CubicO group peptidase (Beta-lactamase class C family) n=2 Tax=Algibacter lectus TaxID=221126 RepID=A0A4R8M7Y1_9FLAO|nr:serine hydrolase [Algibacter lectus]TDY61028.1 CubicO group peptidase (beta-lactamase class C family) [Algibacter lectus]